MTNIIQDYLDINPINGIELVGVTYDYDFAENNGNKYHRKSTTLSYIRE
jgi:hypothetical protein